MLVSTELVNHLSLIELGQNEIDLEVEKRLSFIQKGSGVVYLQKINLCIAHVNVGVLGIVFQILHYLLIYGHLLKVERFLP